VILPAGARRGLVGLLVVGTVTVGCSSGGGGAPRVSAVVEGTEIPASATEELLRTALEDRDGQPAEGDHEESGRERLARFVLLYQIKHAYLERLAREMGITVEVTPEDEMVGQVAPPEDYEAAGLPPEELVRESRAGRLSKSMAERLFPDVSVTEEALSQEYDRRAGANESSWRVRAKVASFTAADQARGLAPRVRQGASFEQVASELGAVNVGTIDITPITPLPQAVLDVVGGLRPADVSDPVQVSTSGWASILVEQREELPRLSFDEARADLTQFLVDQQRQQLFSDWFSQKLRTARIEVDGHYGRWDPDVATVR
jgi:hypothetical protein